ERVAEEAVDDVPTVGVEPAHRELVTQQAEVALDKVKERANARVALAIVIAEGAFVVPGELRPAVVGAHLPTGAEALVDFKFNRSVDANRFRESVWLTVCAQETCGGGVGNAKISNAITGEVGRGTANPIGAHWAWDDRSCRRIRWKCSSGEIKLDWVDKEVGAGARVADQVVLVEAALEGFRRKTGHVFH